MASDCLIEVTTLAALAFPASPESWLAPDEQARFRAIRAPLRQRQYLAGHWLVRALAARCFGGEPVQWRWDGDAGPRPQLLRGGVRAWASISHSGEHLAAAVAAQPIGLDLERPHRQRDVMALAGYMFAPEEVARLLDITEGAPRDGLFYALWALKEGRGKRGGEGLQASQARRVASRPCEPAGAEAWHWPLPGQGSLALAAWPGALFDVRGLPDTAPATPWKYVPLD